MTSKIQLLLVGRWRGGGDEKINAKSEAYLVPYFLLIPLLWFLLLSFLNLKANPLPSPTVLLKNLQATVSFIWSEKSKKTTKNEKNNESTEGEEKKREEENLLKQEFSTDNAESVLQI